MKMRTGTGNGNDGTGTRSEIYALVKVFMREALKTAIDRHRCTGGVTPIGREMIREALVQHTVDPRGCGAELEKYLTASLDGRIWVRDDEEPTPLAMEIAAEITTAESYDAGKITDDLLADIGPGPIYATCFCDKWEENLKISESFVPETPIQEITKRVLDDLRDELSAESALP